MQTVVLTQVGNASSRLHSKDKFVEAQSAAHMEIPEKVGALLEWIIMEII